MSESTDRIEKSIFIQASVSRVWKALTDHEEFGAWFLVALDGPFLPGVPVSGEMTGEYAGYRWYSVTEEVVPESKFSFRWETYDSEEGEERPFTRVTFTLEAQDGGCLLTVVEEGFDKLPSHRAIEAYRSNVEGWEIQLSNIHRYVSQSS